MITASSNDWFLDTWGDLWQVPASAILILLAVISTVRFVGLRSFSKMSSFDFAVTVSIGSIIASVVASSTDVVDGAVAVMSLLLVQAAISWLRSRRQQIQPGIDNTPILLMDGSDFLHENLQKTRVTEGDVLAKIRAANVMRLSEIRAVVLETTGGRWRTDDSKTRLNLSLPEIHGPVEIVSNRHQSDPIEPSVDEPPNGLDIVVRSPAHVGRRLPWAFSRTIILVDGSRSSKGGQEIARRLTGRSPAR